MFCMIGYINIEENGELYTEGGLVCLVSLKELL